MTITVSPKMHMPDGTPLNIRDTNDGDVFNRIGLNMVGNPVYRILKRFMDGAAGPEIIDGSITESGGVVSVNIEQLAGGDLTFVFAGELYTLDCTTVAPLSLALTAGTDITPVKNYIFVTESGGVLTLEKNITGFPVTAFAPIGTAVIPSAALVATDGVYASHAWVDHVNLEGDSGHMAHVNEWIRARPAEHIDGVASGDLASGLFLSTAAGNIRQLHSHVMPARDMFTGDPLFISNEPTTPNLKITQIDSITQDSEGVAIGNNKYFNLVLWGVVSEKEVDCKLFANLPNASYSNQADADADVNVTANYNLPSAFKGTAFLIARYVIQKKAGTWIQSSKHSELGKFPSTSPGSGGPIGDHNSLSNLTVGDVHTQYMLNPSRTVVVDPAGRFATIAAGLVEALTLTPTALNPVTVCVMAGVYAESGINVPEGVFVVSGSGLASTAAILGVTPNTATGFTVQAGGGVYGITTLGASGVGGIGVEIQSGSSVLPGVVENCRFILCHTGLKIAGATTIAFDIGSDYQLNTTDLNISTAGSTFFQQNSSLDPAKIIKTGSFRSIYFEGLGSSDPSIRLAGTHIHFENDSYAQFEERSSGPSTPAAAEGQLYFKNVGGRAHLFTQDDVGEADLSAAGGETNTASNVGAGLGKPFKTKVASDLQFKSVAAGTNILITNGVNDITVALTGTVAIANGGTGSTTAAGARSNLGIVLPSQAFSAHRTAVQSIGSSAAKVQFNTEAFDPQGVYDNVSNHRYTPTIEGYYQINALVGAQSTLNSGTSFYTAIYKNGSEYKRSKRKVSNSTTAESGQISSLIFMNGTTDYIEIFHQSSNTENWADSITNCEFSGYLAVPA